MIRLIDKLISCFFEKLAYLLVFEKLASSSGKLNFRILIGGLTLTAAI